MGKGRNDYLFRFRSNSDSNKRFFENMKKDSLRAFLMKVDRFLKRLCKNPPMSNESADVVKNFRKTALECKLWTVPISDLKISADNLHLYEGSNDPNAILGDSNVFTVVLKSLHRGKLEYYFPEQCLLRLCLQKQDNNWRWQCLSFSRVYRFDITQTVEFPNYVLGVDSSSILDKLSSPFIE
jgi:hypothetical protein